MENRISAETLFKKDKAGNIVYWDCAIVSNPDFVNAMIDIRQGRFGGKEKIHKDTITEGKNIGKSNETTPLAQASSEALSRRNKKLDEGYKTLGMVGLEFNDDLEKLHTQLLEAVSDTKTDADGEAKPMLAHDYEKHSDKVRYPCFIQPKLDGVRCLAKVTIIGKELSCELISRGGKRFSLPDVEKSVKELVFQYARLKNADPVDPKRKTPPKEDRDQTYILDGELYNPTLTFEQVVSGVKGNDYNSHLISYHIYDVVGKQPMHERVSELITLKGIVKHDGQTNQNLLRKVNIVPTVEVDHAEHIENSLVAFENDGHEGVMVRSFDGLYESTRSYGLLKYKTFDSNDYVVMGFELGSRGVEDLIVVCMTESGDYFRAKMTGTTAFKQSLYGQQQELTGKKITVKHFGLTSDSIPRFPIGIMIRNYEV